MWRYFFLVIFGLVQYSYEETCPFNTDVLDDPLRIGAWNIQRLGKTKSSKADVMEVIVKVLHRFDIIVLQEVVDSTGEAQKFLLDLLNDYTLIVETDYDEQDALNEPPVAKYSMIQSERIGRSRYKEQYVYYYRHDRVAVNSSFQYPDANDTFQIEPFVVIFDTPTVLLDKLALIPIHTSPGAAEKEIDALVEVYDALPETTGVEDAIILGDFNAGCNYVTGSEWGKIRLRNDVRFEWLISDHSDTTTKSTSCPYDRIVIVGPLIGESIYKKSAKPFYFDEYYNLTDLEFVLDVSDHYPIEVLLKGNIKPSYAIYEPKISISLQVTASNESISEFWSYYGNLQQLQDAEDIAVKLNDVEEDRLINNSYTAGGLAKNSTETQQLWTDIFLRSNQDGIMFAEFGTVDMESTVALLQDFSLKHRCLFAQNAVEVLVYKLHHGVLELDASLHGEKINTKQFKIILLCLDRNVCNIAVESETNII